MHIKNCSITIMKKYMLNTEQKNTERVIRMRVNYPQEIHDEAEFLSHYMEYDSERGWHIKDDAPSEVVERYETWIKKMHEIADME